MSVSLAAISHPIIEGCETPGQFIAYCARVSNPNNQLNHGSAGKLLSYMVQHQHWSPFEMVSMTLAIETTRDIARQILRHRSFSFQEFSQRYAAVTEPMQPRPCRLQHATNRQSSVATDDSDLADWWLRAQGTVVGFTEAVYEDALRRGIAKEVARVVLPEGMTPSRLYMAGNIRSWIHYVQLRTGNGTQLEHQVIATACYDILLDNIPELGDLLDPTTYLGDAR